MNLSTRSSDEPKTTLNYRCSSPCYRYDNVSFPLAEKAMGTSDCDYNLYAGWHYQQSWGLLAIHSEVFTQVTEKEMTWPIVALIIGISLMIVGYIRLTNWKDSYGFLVNFCIFFGGGTMAGWAIDHLIHIIFPHLFHH